MSVMKIRWMLCAALLTACAPHRAQVTQGPYDLRASARETTLGGQDRNQDGVRDDLAAAITRAFTGDRRAALLRYVQAAGYLVTAQTDWELTQAAQRERASAACMRAAFGAQARAEITRAQAALGNTPHRLKALQNADRRVRTLKLPPAPACPLTASGPSGAPAGQ